MGKNKPENYKQKAIKKNKHNKFLQEPTIHLRGSQTPDDLEKLEKITKTKHPSVQEGYIQKIKKFVYQKGQENYEKGVQNLEQHLESITNSKLFKLGPKLETKHNLSILTDGNTIFIAKYHTTNTKKNKRRAKKSLNNIENILKHEQNQNNIKTYYGTENLIIYELTLDGFILINYVPKQ